MTISSTPYHQLVECKCSDCKDSDWRCYAELGCFSVLKQDENDNYVVSKGCFENALHRKINCENPVTPAVCCEENMCNWNVTPTFPTKKSSKCQLLIIDSCGGIFFLCMHYKLAELLQKLETDQKWFENRLGSNVMCLRIRHVFGFVFTYNLHIRRQTQG